MDQISTSQIHEACRKGTLCRILNNYIRLCHPSGEENIKRSARSSPSFPNLAGFCRYMGSGVDELLSIRSEYPDELDRVLAILEDEALNSGAPPALLSIYLKKRLGYEKDSSQEACDTRAVSICFEHDIFRDGE